MERALLPAFRLWRLRRADVPNEVVCRVEEIRPGQFRLAVLLDGRLLCAPDGRRATAHGGSVVALATWAAEVRAKLALDGWTECEEG